MIFKNRRDAGEKLAIALQKHKSKEAVVYAMPRGGVPLGKLVAESIGSPLDLIIVRKVTHPSFPEFAICAVTETGRRICNDEEARMIDRSELERLVINEIREAKRRRKVYLPSRAHIPAKDKIAIIVDDGVATGLTMRLAIEKIKNEKPKKIIVAVPVIPKEVYMELKTTVDEIVALDIPEYYLGAVGNYYDEFHQLEDKEVIEALKETE